MKTCEQAWEAWLKTLPQSVQDNIRDIERASGRAYTHEAFIYAWYASEDNDK